jgi:hypothetical protein
MMRPERRLRFLKLGDIALGGADYPYLAIEDSLAKLGVRHRLSPRTERGKMLMRATSRLRLARPILRFGRTAYLVPTGQLGEGRYVPVTYFNEVIPFYFDAWPNLWEPLAALLRRHRVRVAFFTARQTAAHFRETMGLDAIWMPEACDPAQYRPDKPLAARGTDVLELGRKYDRYHDAIAPALAADGRSHLFERVKGRMIFDTREAMIGGFADAKVSVCFPSSITHPERSGHVETVTHRYFESIASRCLILGHGPAELTDLFGYDPVVRADDRDPAGQLRDVLARVEDYQPLIDRNYRRLLEVGTWDVRMRAVLDELAKRGYRP